jgi:hypothetical protein
MTIFINSNDFVFDAEDLSLEPIPFNKDVLNILSQCEGILKQGISGAVSCDPTPIGSSIHVVGQVQVTENTWYPEYYSILSLLRTLPHRQQKTIEKPRLSSSCFKSLQQQQQQHQQQQHQRKVQDPTPQRSRISSVTTSADDPVADMAFSADRSTSSSQGSGLSLTRLDQWNDRFQELADFRQKHGHSLVPHSHPESPSLSLWVKRQRYQYKLHREGKHCTMTDEREATLEQLGFVWDSHAATWDERFSELSAFQSECGHCNVPTSFPANPQLAVWVKSQRRQFKLFVSGRKSYMSKERKIQLSRLGFVFNPRKLKGGMERN